MSEKQIEWYYEAKEFDNRITDLIRAHIHTNCEMRYHRHDFYELNIVTSGKGVHIFNNVEVNTKVGDVFFIHPGMSHGYIHQEELDVFHIMIKKHFRDTYSEELDGLFGAELLWNEIILNKKISAKSPIISLSNTSETAVENILYDITMKDDKKFDIARTLLCLSLFERLSSLLYDAENKQEPRMSYDAIVLDVIHRIRQSYLEQVTLDDLLIDLPVSKAVLMRKFRDMTGMSPIAYLLRLRAYEAGRMIEEKRYSKTDIAKKCGFYDVSHMNKTLKKMKGREETFHL